MNKTIIMAKIMYALFVLLLLAIDLQCYPLDDSSEKPTDHRLEDHIQVIPKNRADQSQLSQNTPAETQSDAAKSASPTFLANSLTTPDGAPSTSSANSDKVRNARDVPQREQSKLAKEYQDNRPEQTAQQQNPQRNDNLNPKRKIRNVYDTEPNSPATEASQSGSVPYGSSANPSETQGTASKTNFDTPGHPYGGISPLDTVPSQTEQTGNNGSNRRLRAVYGDDSNHPTNVDSRSENSEQSSTTQRGNGYSSDYSGLTSRQSEQTKNQNPSGRDSTSQQNNDSGSNITPIPFPQDQQHRESNYQTRNSRDSSESSIDS